MARIAFIGDDLALRSCLDAVVGATPVDANVKAAAAVAYEAVVVDASSLGFGPAMLAELAVGGPVLILAHPEELPAQPGDNLVLAKPFELTDLRRKLKEVAKARREARLRPVETPDVPAAETRSLAEPDPTQPLVAHLDDYIERSSTIAALSGRVWLVGPTGVGKRQTALALASHFGLPLLSWSEHEPRGGTQSSLNQLAKNSLLWIPSLEALSLTAQDELGDFLDTRNGIVVTASANDCGAALAAQRFSRRLFHLLAGSQLEFASLAQRRDEIPDLVATVLDGLTARSDLAAINVDAKGMALLQAYPWPGNDLELEAVLVRSVAAALHTTKARVGKLKLGQEHLLLAMPSREPLFDDGAAERPSAHLAVVRPVGTTAANPVVAAAARTSGLSIELLVAGLAHDLRNPMVTLKTFATLGQSADGDNELGELAVAACSRADAQLDLLQAYCDLSEPSPEVVELVDLLENAGRDDTEPALMIDARYPVAAVIDATHARFIAAALAEEAAASSAPCQTTVNLEEGSCEVIFALPESSRATAHLSNLVATEDALPWRLALAAEVAQRNGGELNATVVGEDLIVRLLVRAAADQDLEEPQGIEQAPAPKRGRRS